MTDIEKQVFFDQVEKDLAGFREDYCKFDTTEMIVYDYERDDDRFLIYLLYKPKYCSFKAKRSNGSSFGWNRENVTGGVSVTCEIIVEEINSQFTKVFIDIFNSVETDKIYHVKSTLKVDNYNDTCGFDTEDYFMGDYTYREDTDMNPFVMHNTRLGNAYKESVDMLIESIRSKLEHSIGIISLYSYDTKE